MDPRQELKDLKRLEELETKAAGSRPPLRPWGEVGREVLSNAPKSSVGVASDFANAVLNPFDTASAIGSLVSGGVKNLTSPLIPTHPGDTDVALADAYGHMQKQHFGSMRGFQDYVAQDPVAALADVGGVLSLGGSALVKLPGIAGKIAETARITGSAIDPAANLARAANLTKKVVVGGGKGISRATDVVTQKGPANIAARTISERAGPLQDRKALVKELESGGASNVPGYQRTAMQSTAGTDAGTGLTASEKQISGMSGGPATLMNRRLREQSEALSNAIGIHARTPEILDLAIKRRKDITAPMYEAAKNSKTPVDTTNVQQIAAQILEDNAKRAKVTQPTLDVLSRVITKAPPRKTYTARNGKTYIIGPPTKAPQLSMKDAMSARDHIKDLLDLRDAAQFPEYDQTVLLKLNEALDAALENSSKTYRTANDTFKAHSASINKMQIAQAIKDRMVNAKDMDSFNAALADFANEERFIARETGFTGAKSFSDVFSPKELKSIYDVRDEMQRGFQAKNPRQPTSAGSFADAVPLSQGVGLNLLDPTVAAGNWMAKRLGRGVEPAVADELIKLHLSPELMAAALKKSIPGRLSESLKPITNLTPAQIGQVIYQAGKVRDQINNPLLVDENKRKAP